MKTCTKCLRELDVYNFSKDSRAKNGMQSACKDCEKAYRDSHKVERAATHKVWSDSHKDERAAYISAWTVANRGKKRIYYAKRRALTLATIPSDTWDMLLDFYGEHCMVPDCTNTNLTLDHIVPLSKGGTHTLDNFQILCNTHNCSKGAWHSTDYRPPLTMTH